MNRIVPANQSKIVIREPEETDTPFFERLYFETRRGEFAALGWDENQLKPFLKMQFDLQTQAYKMQFPGARISVIESGGEAVGRLVTTDEIRLVDIAVLPDVQNRGIGSFVLRRLLDEAQGKGKFVDLQVLKTNVPAIRLYERFGFEKTSESDLYLMMQWRDLSQ
jgi:ribosomal protein S18 acetylase RimI-like enzyme